MGVLSHVVRRVPPPRYLTLPSVGVDISDTSIKYVTLSPGRRGKGRKLLSWGDIDIPSGVLSRGEVNDITQLSAVLREFKQKTRAEFVRVSLPEERAYLFETELKRDVPQREIRNTLEFRLEENVPIPSRDVYFDYAVLPTTGKGEGEKRVVVAAYARDTLTKYHEACVAAGLVPLSFEVEAQAMARAVVPTKSTGTVMVVDFGKTRTGVGIVTDGLLLYTSTIDIGGGSLSQVMRKVLGERAEAELTEIKNTQGLIRGADDSRVHDALIGTISVVKDELAARMQYWHLKENTHPSRRIGAVILCGGSVNLKGFPEYLTEMLGVPCERANVWANVASFDETVPPIEKRFSYGYATAVGLSLAHNI